jgi:hypothetical protein
VVQVKITGDGATDVKAYSLLAILQQDSVRLAAVTTTKVAVITF